MASSCLGRPERNRIAIGCVNLSQYFRLRRGDVWPTLQERNVDKISAVERPTTRSEESGMTLNQLHVGSNLARDDIQQTDFGYDVVPRYICNNWDEIAAAQGAGAYPFDVIVIGAGMFGGYAAEKLYRGGAGAALRTLLIDAGAFLLQSHIQNLPQQLGGSVGSPRYLRTRDDSSGAQNIVWGMPWISNEAFPGLAYCICGRSLFWGGWSTELTPADLGNWPAGIATYLNSASGYASTEAEIGTATTTDFVRQTALFNALLNGLRAALPLSGGSRPRPCLRAARPQDGGFTSRSPRQMWRDRIPKS
jgi:hypothetical protein